MQPQFSQSSTAVPFPTPHAAPQQQEPARLARLKHGLHSKFAVLPGEDRAEFEAFRADMMEDLDPQHPYEAVLVHQLVHAQWILQRLWANEVGLHQQYAEHHDVTGVPYSQAVAQCGLWDASEDKELERLSRAKQRVFNQFHKALRALPLVRDQRRKGLLGKPPATDSSATPSPENADRRQPTGNPPRQLVGRSSRPPAQDRADIVPPQLAGPPPAPAAPEPPLVERSSQPFAPATPESQSVGRSSRPPAPPPPPTLSSATSSAENADRPLPPTPGSPEDLERLAEEHDRLGDWMDQLAKTG